MKINYSNSLLRICEPSIFDSTIKRNEIMKAINTTKYGKVENTDLEFLAMGIVAFQLVKFEINFYGKLIETTHDTKIMKDGSQIVIGGCGYIKEGYIL